jgi:hypothetical protein
MVNSAIFLLYLNLASTWTVMQMTSVNGVLNSVVVWSARRWLERKNRQKAWTLITTLVTGLILMNHETTAQPASGNTAPGLTCSLSGIPAHEKARYEWLVESLHQAIQKRRELPDGYAFQIDTQQIDTSQLVEWVELERKCCPFFGFEIRWDRQDNAVWLNLTGPEGVKDFISASRIANRGE